MKQLLVLDVPMTQNGKHICNYCPLWVEDGGYCNYKFVYSDDMPDRCYDCPLMSIPDKVADIVIEAVQAIEALQAMGKLDDIQIRYLNEGEE